MATEVSRSEVVAPTAYNTALAENAITFSAVPQTPKRIGVFIPVTAGVLQAAGFVEVVLRQLLHDDLLRVLATT